jgi:hypothetical protein
MGGVHRVLGLRSRLALGDVAGDSGKLRRRSPPDADDCALSHGGDMSTRAVVYESGTAGHDRGDRERPEVLHVGRHDCRGFLERLSAEQHIAIERFGRGGEARAEAQSAAARLQVAVVTAT